MSTTSPIQAFLAGKSFVIPRYQRDYAWTIEEAGELFSDVQEALDSNTSHYLGTIVLAQTHTVFEIVDGQQRLSTLVLMIHALLNQLEATDPVRIADDIYLLRQGSNLKLNFGANHDFVVALFGGDTPTPTTRGQRRLQEVYGYCRERTAAIGAAKANNIHKWLDTIKGLEIIPFIEVNPGRAISIFQSVNDRGKKLTDMDKAKALLVLYSNRFLKGTLDTRISEAFGKCFSAYDQIRELAGQEGYKIESINRTSFSEDDLLRYHYLAYDAVEANDYYGYSQTILGIFLKPALRSRQDDTESLQKFISEYVSDLEDFACAFAELVESTRSDTGIFTLLVVHGLAARLYPTTIRLHQRKMLTIPIQVGCTTDILHCIEVVDLRVYKIRGTDPAKDVGDLSHASKSLSEVDIANFLRDFVAKFMPDSLMQTHLGGRMYKSGAVVPILLAFEQSAVNHAYNMPKLVELIKHGPTQEHILSQEPSFDFVARGFKDQTEFDEFLDKLGNLSLLTGGENSRSGNKSAELKMSQPDLYLSSRFAGPRILAQKFSVSGASFDKAAVMERTEALSQFAITNWAIWPM